MPILRSIIAVIALTFAELYVTVHAVPDAIGAPATIALLVASSLLGVALLKQQGRLVWRRFTAAVAEGRIPERELLDGVIVIFGGALLIMPGFVTDALGLVMLVPLTRPVTRRAVERWLRRTAVGRIAARRGARRRPDNGDIDGSATDYHAGDARMPPARQLGR